MPDNLTTQSLPHDPEATALFWRDRGICLPAAPAPPEPDVDEPDDPQQAELPTGATHVAARRSPDQLASARKFIAAAGRVKFDRGRATLKAVWMVGRLLREPGRRARAGVLRQGGNPRQPRARVRADHAAAPRHARRSRPD